METGEISAWTTDRVFDGFEQEWQVGAAFEHEFGNEDHNLAIDFAYGRYDEEEDNYFDENFTHPEPRQDITHYLITKGGPITEIQVEYANPIAKDTELELGYDLLLYPNPSNGQFTIEMENPDREDIETEITRILQRFSRMLVLIFIVL